MPNVIHATQDDFSNIVLESKKPVLVDFWAPWCRPCILMGPVLDELSVEMNEVVIVKVDVEDPKNQNLAHQYEIRSIPNMKLFKGGKIVHEFVGLMAKESLRSEILAALA